MALAAIQGLHAQNQELMAENRAQRARIDALARQNAEFEARLSALEADQGAAGGPLGANPLLWTGGLLLAVAGVWSFRRDWSAKTGGEGAR